MEELGYINTSYKLKHKKSNNAIGKKQVGGYVIQKRRNSNTYQDLPNLTISEKTQIKTPIQFHNHNIGKIFKSGKTSVGKNVTNGIFLYTADFQKSLKNYKLSD